MTGRPAPVLDGIRVAIGTLTVLPVPPPLTVDRRSGSWAMVFAPLVGLVLAVPACLLLWLVGWPFTGFGTSLLDGLTQRGLPAVGPATPLLAAALAVGLLALLTRAIHLDGLADTVDGLGSGKPAAEALAIMRRGDIGPFGVVSVVLVLVVQIVSLGQLLALGHGPLALTFALVLSRLVLPFVCLRGLPAARPDGLGRSVAGSVSPAQLLLAVAFGTAVLVAAGAVAGFGVLDVGVVVRALVVVATGLLAGAFVCWRCVRRLGGVTGDVMGACVEVTFTVVLVVLTFA